MLKELTAQSAVRSTVSIAEISKALQEREDADKSASLDAWGEKPYDLDECGLERAAQELLHSTAHDTSQDYRVALPADHSDDAWGSLQAELDVLLQQGHLTQEEEGRVCELHDALEKALGAHDVDGEALLSFLSPEKQQKFAELDAELTLLYEQKSLSPEEEERMDFIIQQMDFLLSEGL